MIRALVPSGMINSLRNWQCQQASTLTFIGLRMQTHSESNSARCPVCNGQSRYDFSGRDLMFDHYERHDYFCCSDCGSIFTHPMPTPDQIAAFYPSNYDIYEEDDRPDSNPNWKKKFILRTQYGYRHLKIGFFGSVFAGIAKLAGKANVPMYVQDGKLLDVGCGNGRFLRTMKSLGWKVFGVEFSVVGVSACRKSDLEVHQGDLHSAHFPDSFFDVITARHVVEHIPEPNNFFAEIARILKPGGQFILETPNSGSLGRRWLGTNWFANEVPRHLILYNRHNLLLLAQNNCLRCEYIHLDTSPKILLNSIDYVIKNRGKPSKKMRCRRFFARLYVWLANSRDEGDVIHAQFRKSTSPCQ